MAKKTKNTAAAPVAGAAEVEAASGFSLAFINHILKPGSSANSTMQTMMNVLYTLLALVLAMLLFSDTSNIHYYAMIGLLVGLAASTNWYVFLPAALRCHAPRGCVPAHGRGQPLLVGENPSCLNFSPPPLSTSTYNPTQVLHFAYGGEG